MRQAPDKDPGDSRSRLPRGKRVLFGLGAVVTFFVLLEGILWVSGVGADPEGGDPLVGFASTVPHFVIEADEAGVEIVRTAPNKLNFLNEQTFARIKPAGTSRVFCVGGSTTYGRPFFDDLSFAGYLRAILPEIDPSRNWEVVNAGGISYASYRVTAVMEELAAFAPDIFIVYTGQNEFLEARTYEALLATPSVVRKSMAWALATRTGTLISRIVSRDAVRRRTILSEHPKGIPVDSVGPEAYHRDDEFRRQVVRHFRRNLNRMVDIAQGAGAKVLFVVPASNLFDFSPFRSEPSPGLTDKKRAEFDQLLRRGIALRDADRNEKARDVLERAVAIDDRHAEAHYQLGKALLAAGDGDRAKKEVERARDEDICPMRAIDRIRVSVLEVASDRGAQVVSMDHVITNTRQEFYDHVHLTPGATGRLAGLIAQELLGRSDAHREIAERVCVERLARRDRTLHAAELRKLTSMLTWLLEPELALRTARDALALDPVPESRVLLGTLLEKDDPATARKQFELALAGDPKSASAHFQLALMEEREDDLADAVAHLESALETAPKFTAAWEKLAMLQVRRGRVNDAVWSFKKVVDLEPKRSSAHSNLGLAYAKQGEPKKAFASYADAIRLDPKNASAHYNKGLLHESRGERGKAIEEFRRVLEISPTHRGARTQLTEIGAPLSR